MCELISHYFINEVARAMTKCEESYKHTYVHMYIRPGKVLGSIPGLATYFRFSFRFFKKGCCQLLAKVCARSTC